MRENVDGIAVDTDPSGRASIVSLRGQLDLLSAPRVRHALSSLRGGTTQVVIIDLCQLDYMDSVGVGLLVSSRQQLEAEGRSMVVRNPVPAVRRLLEITGLEDYLGVEVEG